MYKLVMLKSNNPTHRDAALYCKVLASDQVNQYLTENGCEQVLARRSGKVHARPCQKDELITTVSMTTIADTEFIVSELVSVAFAPKGNDNNTKADMVVQNTSSPYQESYVVRAADFVNNYVSGCQCTSCHCAAKCYYPIDQERIYYRILEYILIEQRNGYETVGAIGSYITYDEQSGLWLAIDDRTFEQCYTKQESLVLTKKSNE